MVQVEGTRAVEAVEVSKVYPAAREVVHAIDDITLEIYPGEMVAVVGKPVSGKSTLLHIFGSLLKPDSGQLRLDGVDLEDADDMKLLDTRLEKVGFMFQAFNLLPDQSVLTNVEAPLWEMGVGSGDRRQKAEEALQRVGLSHRLKHLPGQLTETQRQRIAIARALVNNPSVIIADEPVKSLDSTGREEIMGLLQLMNDAGKTIIISSSESGVGRYCRRLLRIDGGKIVEDSLVTNRRVLPTSKSGNEQSEDRESREAEVCPRCNMGNPAGAEICNRCKCPVQLTSEGKEAILGRLTKKSSQLLGVESTSDEGEVPCQEMISELQQVPVFSSMGAKNLLKVLPTLEQMHFAKGSKILNQGDEGDSFYVISPNPPKDTDGRGEGSGRGWVRELQGRWPGVLG